MKIDNNIIDIFNFFKNKSQNLKLFRYFYYGFPNSYKIKEFLRFEGEKFTRDICCNNFSYDFNFSGTNDNIIKFNSIKKDYINSQIFTFDDTIIVNSPIDIEYIKEYYQKAFINLV